MPPVGITFRTSSSSKLRWLDSFEDLEDEEIEELILHCRNAAASLDAELLQRRQRLECDTLKNLCDMLLKYADETNQSGFVRGNHDLDDLYTFVANTDNVERRDAKIARQYLWFMSRVMHCWSYALLILCTFGKNRVIRFNEVMRACLIKHIVRHHVRLFCPVLRAKAIELNLDQIRKNSAFL